MKSGLVCNEDGLCMPVCFSFSLSLALSPLLSLSLSRHEIMAPAVHGVKESIHLNSVRELLWNNEIYFTISSYT